MESSVEQKSFAFAVRIVNLSRYLIQAKKETILSKQLLRSGTSIGANIAEAQQAQSRADFISKNNIALKEVAETDYWLRLLKETKYLSDSQFLSIYQDCIEIKKMLVAIVKTSNNNYQLSPINYQLFRRCLWLSFPEKTKPLWESIFTFPFAGANANTVTFTP